MALNNTGSLIEKLECSRCKREFDPDAVQTVCTNCSGSLLARYDLERAKEELSKERSFRRRPASMWRYRELLPVKNELNVVTLGEGFTPVLRAKRLEDSLRLKSSPSIFVKDDGVIPTGTFKARGQSAAISKAKELGIRSVALASAGNAGAASAAYCARAGIECNVFMPKDAPESTKKECSQMGASLHLVDGLINDAAKKVVEGKSANGWFELSTLKEPYRVEGKKTMGFEIAEQFDWNDAEMPEAIVYPTGGGTGLLGMWKAFREMETLGWIGKKPRMISVQSSGCAPIVRAFEEGNEAVAEPFPAAATIASGLRVPFPYASEQILKAIRESGGFALAVRDSEILSAMERFAKLEGMLVCPEGAATLACLERLLSERVLDRSDRILLYNTGSGLKYLDLIASARL